jgi:hypothetical protein
MRCAATNVKGGRCRLHSTSSHVCHVHQAQARRYGVALKDIEVGGLTIPALGQRCKKNAADIDVDALMRELRELRVYVSQVEREATTA